MARLTCPGPPPPAGMDAARAVLASAGAVQRHLVLLADAGGGAPIRGEDRLQNMMFMASKADGKLGEECGFGQGIRGPYSEVVSGEMGHLADVGVLCASGSRIGITRAGRRIAREMSKSSGEDTPLMLYNLKLLFNDLPAKEALAYICAAHPEMAAGSAEYEKIKPELEKILLSLIRKEKITSGRASELLGMPRHYVIGLMKDAGIAYLH